MFIITGSANLPYAFGENGMTICNICGKEKPTEANAHRIAYGKQIGSRCIEDPQHFTIDLCPTHAKDFPTTLQNWMKGLKNATS